MTGPHVVDGDAAAASEQYDVAPTASVRTRHTGARPAHSVLAAAAARLPVVAHQPSSAAPVGPVRTCIGCRRRVAKRELLRVTAGSDADGRPAVVPDPTATAPGRGAHLHPTTECYDLAVRRRAFGRALRAEPGLDSTPVGDHLRQQQGLPAHVITG